MENTPKKLLPSRQFALIIAICIVGVLVTLYITSQFGTKDSFSRNEYEVKNANITLEEAITLDSNKNGIADWEESLWGLDPKGNGAENKRSIDSKKTEAGIPLEETTQPTENQEKPTETEQFSKNLLATVLALQENGSLTPEAIANLGNAFGQNIDAKRSVTPSYFESSITLTPDIYSSYKEYSDAIKRIVKKYDTLGVGSELKPITDVMIEETSVAAAIKLTTIGKQYQSFAKEVISLKTPEGIAPFSLELANTADAIGISLEKIAVIQTDALGGMIGVDEYTTNSDRFISASEDLTSFLTAILK